MDNLNHPLEREEALLDRIRNGEMAALLELYRSGRNTIRAFVTRNSGSADEAEDILQEALVVFWQRVRADRFEPRAQPGTFLFATARNLWFRQLARKKRERAINPGDLQTEDGSTSPLDTMVATEDSQKVQEALTQLPEQCRLLLIAFYWEELSMEEIAVRFNYANAQTAKSKKYQCKRILKELLTKQKVQS